MPYSIVEDKIAEISPQYRGELLAFIDFLIFRQRNSATANGADFSEKKLAWRPELEKKLDSWESQGNLAASILELDKAGFDMLPCTSNWSSPQASDAMLKFCKARVDPAHLKGFMTAPWAKSIALEMPKVSEGIKLFAEAKRKYYS